MDGDSAVLGVREQRDFYDSYWSAHATQLNPDEIMRLAKILDAYAASLGGRMAPRPPRICDLGCGRGWLAAELVKFGPVTGVDLSPEGVAIAEQRYPGVAFQAADILSWRPGGSFDLVVSSEVLEHVPDKQRFARTVEAILRPGGHLILTTPNGPAKSAFFAAGHEKQIIEDWVSMAQLRRLFADSFDILRHESFVFDFGYTGFRRVSSAPKLLSLLKSTKLLPFYDTLRQSLGLGLYQILLARRR